MTRFDSSPLDVFLREHAFVHTEAVARAHSINIDYLITGLTAPQLRTRPHGLNSIAWIVWHVARVEDAFVSGLVMRRQQLLHEGQWAARLNVERRDFGTGMTKSEVAELSDRIDLAALWAYRDEVGRRTRSMAVELANDGWSAPIRSEDIQRAVDAGIFTSKFATALGGFLPGRSRESALFWWGLNHTVLHLGQVTMLHGLLKTVSV
jgi:hypothetical protein